MGDSGSFLIGFTIVWLLIHSSQSISNEVQAILMKPVTALWLIAVPLMDMAMVMLRRLRKKQSPFKADRLHLHHICMRLGLSSRQTLAFITFWALLFAAFGILGQVFQVHEHVMLILFLLAFTCYVFIISYIWRITCWIRKRFQIGKTHVTVSS